MHGPEILAGYLSNYGPPDRHGVSWQYHSRSDRHSKVACWGVAFDLLANSALMQAHAVEGKIVLGVNHPMRDFATGRRKVLDLIVARPDGAVRRDALTLRELAMQYEIELTPREVDDLHSLPDIPVAPVGTVLVALEAKATMTEHTKSLPRLYDELNSSHLCVHGDSGHALAIAYVQVNSSDEFISPIINSAAIAAGQPPRVSFNRQPVSTQRVIEKVADLPRRANIRETGFDAIGVSVVELRNDGSPVHIVQGPPAPRPGESFHYDSMILRMANEYDTRFARI